MNLQKTAPYRNRKMLDAAKDQPCIRCGKEGETRSCHYNGLYQHIYGTGTQTKCSDFMTAEFCQTCDETFTEGNYAGWDSIEDRDIDFHYWIAMTNIRRLKNGYLKG